MTSQMVLLVIFMAISVSCVQGWIWYMPRCEGVQFEGRCFWNFTVCGQQPLAGTCAGSETRYYWVQQSASCQQFSYSGCGGNSNNFYSRQQCADSCTNSIPEYDLKSWYWWMCALKGYCSMLRPNSPFAINK